jgi:hypothetical protein
MAGSFWSMLNIGFTSLVTLKWLETMAIYKWEAGIK